MLITPGFEQLLTIGFFNPVYLKILVNCGINKYCFKLEIIPLILTICFTSSKQTCILTKPKCMIKFSVYSLITQFYAVCISRNN